MINEYDEHGEIVAVTIYHKIKGGWIYQNYKTKEYYTDGVKEE